VNTDIYNLRYLVDTIDENSMLFGLDKISAYIKSQRRAIKARREITHERDQTPRKRPWGGVADFLPDFGFERGGIVFAGLETDEESAARRRLEERRGPLYDAIRHVVDLSWTKTLDEITEDDIVEIMDRFNIVLGPQPNPVNALGDEPFIRDADT
jgi:hypothetical protein